MGTGSLAEMPNARHPGAGKGRAPILRVLAFLLLWASLASPTVAAPQPQGAEEPAFGAALEHWLDGDEATALPALAEQAAAGNAAAQLLLGVINITPSLQGPWLDAQDRATRISLMRRPEVLPSLSGQSWLTDSADARALVWARALQADAPLTVILDFTRLGEPRAAAQAAFRLLSRQRRGFAALDEAVDFPDFLVPYAALETGDPAGLAPADPHRALFGAHERDPQALSQWIESHADAIAAVCQTICPAEPATICRPAALAGLGGPMGLLHSGSPVEALIPSPRFNRSPKGTEMMLALMSQAGLAAAPAPSPCLAAAIP
jgi:hypothetical protein